MNVELKVKIKLKDNIELELTENEINELYNKLKSLCEKNNNYWTYPVYPTYPTITWNDSHSTTDKIIISNPDDSGSYKFSDYIYITN